MPYPELPAPRGRGRLAVIVIALFVLLISARTIATFIIDYNWWREMDQLSTWFSMLSYRLIPTIVAALIAIGVLMVAHSRGLRFAEVGRIYNPWYWRIVLLILVVVGFIVGTSSIDTWAVVRFFGGRNLPPETLGWQEPVFGRPLTFFLFDLPFYSILRGYVLAVTFAAAFVYWVTARGWQLKDQLPEIQQTQEVDPRMFRLEGGLESKFLRGAAAVFLVALATRYFLGRYEMVYNEHGFMVGVDWVNENITLPLQWLVIAWCLLAAAFVWMGRWVWAVSLIVVLALHAIVPRVVGAVYVRPNEIAIQRPYINTHIHASRAAFSLDRRAKEFEYQAQLESAIDPSQHKALFDNVRLWDWRAFHDTISQIQALRTYYVFSDSDVDRYVIDGQLRQVMLSPRELDIRQLPDAQTSWINPHFVYTHGYGMVMAEANRITANGLPVLFVQDAPPTVKAANLKLTRPEIYYGEVNHEPVFVRTKEREFNYPSGAENVFSRYEGTGGFPVSSLPMRVASALAYGDVNILLTSVLTGESRMMIRRKVRPRLQELAGFIAWDEDPYLVLTDEGRLVWTLDGYTTSRAHPYSQTFRFAGLAPLNYIRNSVKATVDAYSGETRLYIFDSEDPIIQSYRQLFPKLFLPESEMPQDLRLHARYPMTMFRIQAEVYRTFHMLDPQAFYNKEDVWDIARNIYGQEAQAQALTPIYVVATVPGEDQAEFLLILPFTPRNKDNLIGLMLARCDGPKLGELLFLQLSKQELFFGTMQIEARINQDQIISKDLSLWNQQGSQVLRGQLMVLPVEQTLVYIEPLYIQAAQARMPQLKKVVLAMGNRLIYRDTYEEALEELASLGGLEPPPPRGELLTQVKEPPPAAASPPPGVDRRVETIRSHLRRYRELSAEGRWAEAGRELEQLESLVK
ncbi:MAG: UPF0182 family protein [Bryobacteraceae bacterium]|nr:UPF0182 family protein [Bryobacteraceae bacterium]